MFVYHFFASTADMVSGPCLDGIIKTETPMTSEEDYTSFRAQIAKDLEVHEEEVIIESLTFLHEVKATVIPFEVQ